MEGARKVEHNKDYDRDHDRSDQLEGNDLKNLLEQSFQVENELMKGYMLTAEKIHNNQELKDRLQNFAEGNAKRTKQLQDELEKL